MELWSHEGVREALKNILYSDIEYRSRCHYLDLAFKGEIDSWDYQLGFFKLINNCLGIVPTKNLITNIGFGHDATHTKSKNQLDMSRFEYEFPLKHNIYIVPDRQYDQSFFQTIILPKSNLLIEKIKRIPLAYTFWKTIKSNYQVFKDRNDHHFC